MSVGDRFRGEGAEVSLTCPGCGRSSTQIKSLRTGVVVYLGVVAFWRFWTETGCAPCVRGKLLGTLALNLLTSHIIWPITILPWTTIQILRTMLAGHSPEVLTQLGLPLPPRRPVWAQIREELPLAFRGVGVAQVLLAALLFAGTVCFLGIAWFSTVHEEWRLIYRGLTALSGLAIGYLACAGVGKVFGRAFPFWINLALGVVVAAFLALSCLSLAGVAWMPRERALFADAMSDERWGTEHYIHRVPPELWRKEPIEKAVAKSLAELSGESRVAVVSDLKSMRYQLEKYHSGNADFNALRRRIADALDPTLGAPPTTNPAAKPPSPKP